VPSIPLDFWISISEKLPWEGPIKMIYKNTMRELPCADPKVVLFSAISAVAHEVRGDIVGVLGNMAKVCVNLGIIGPTGSGKTTIPTLILSKLGIKRVGSRSSPEGIGRKLSEEGAVVHLCDEVQQIFRGRKKDEYVGALVDLWKSSFTKAPLTMARRSTKKTIDIPSSAKLTIIWTTTEDDIDKVSEVIDTALLRRFLIIKTSAEVDPLTTGEETDWTEVLGVMKFIDSFHWRFYPEIDDMVVKFRDSIIELFEDKPLMKMILSEYGVRIACVLALDRVVSDILKQAQKMFSKTVFVTADGVWNQLVTALQNLLISNQQKLADAFVKAVDDQTPVVYRSESEKFTSDERIIDTSDLIRSDILSRCTSSISTLLSRYVSMSVYQKSPSVDVHAMVDELMSFMERNIWRSPTITSESMNVIDVRVPPEYTVLGMTVTALALVDTSDMVRWFGWDEDWLYFVKKCYELSERFGEFNIRTLARYLSRLNKYSVIKEFLERALDAGYLEITKCEDAKDITKCWFRVVR